MAMGSDCLEGILVGEAGLLSVDMDGYRVAREDLCARAGASQSNERASLQETADRAR